MAAKKPTSQRERDMKAKETRMRQDHPLNRSLAARQPRPTTGKKK